MRRYKATQGNIRQHKVIYGNIMQHKQYTAIQCNTSNIQQYNATQAIYNNIMQHKRTLKKLDFVKTKIRNLRNLL